MITIWTDHYTKDQLVEVAVLFKKAQSELISESCCANSGCKTCPYKRLCDGLGRAAKYAEKKLSEMP